MACSFSIAHSSRGCWAAAPVRLPFAPVAPWESSDASIAVKSDKTSEGRIMAEAPYPYPSDSHQPHDRHGIPVHRIAWTIGRKFHATSRNRIQGINGGVKSSEFLSINANWCSVLPSLAVGDSMQLPRWRNSLHDLRRDALPSARYWPTLDIGALGGQSDGSRTWKPVFKTPVILYELGGS